MKRSISIEINSLLSRWLRKRTGSADVDTLSPEERNTYNLLRSTLEGKELTSEDVYRFWTDYEELVKNKIIENGIPDHARDLYIVELRLIKTVRSFLNSSETQAHNARVMLEKSLTN